MLSRLPEFVDPFLLAEKGREFEGSIFLKRMKRVASLVAAGEHDHVQVKIRFQRDPVGQALITGRARVVLQLQCQRCLEAMDFSVDTEFQLGVVSTLTEAAELPESYEPLVVEENPMPLAEIIEDEILLALPAVAVHDAAHCAVNLAQVDGGDSKPLLNETVEPKPAAPPAGVDAVSNEDLSEEKPNPFAVLADLKGKLSK